MSSNSDSGTGVPSFSPSPGQFVPLVQLGYYENCIASAGLGWLAYDYLLTFPLEVSAIWNSKITITTVLFLLNRYSSIVSWIARSFESLYLVENLQSPLCTVIYSLDFASFSIATWSTAVILWLRTCAICGQNRILICFAAVACLSSIGLQIWYIVLELKETGIVIFPNIDHIGNCASLAPPSPALVTSIVSLVIQTVVFMVTLLRTGSIYRQARMAGVEAKLAGLLLRDGSLYFLILSVMSLLSLAALFLWSENLPPFVIALGNMAHPLEAVLINRLVLNLRSLDRSMDASKPSGIKTDIFFRQAYGAPRNQNRSFVATILGNIGEPLRVDDDDLSENDPLEDKRVVGTGEGAATTAIENLMEVLLEDNIPVIPRDEPAPIKEVADV